MPTESLFPEWEAAHGGPPPQPVTKDSPWSPGPNARAVLDALRMWGPADDWTLHGRVVGRMTRTSCTRAIDELAAHGAIADTGERGRWTAKGRLIVWRAV